MTSAITIKSSFEISLMRTANKIVAEALNMVMESIGPGVSTKELDLIAENCAKKNNASSAFKGYRGYPASLCVSINDQVVHGIPTKKNIIQLGDIVSIDFGVNYKGYFGDAALSTIVGFSKDLIKCKLLNVTQESLLLGIRQARPGNRISDISFAIQSHIETNNFHVVKQFVGHGIGNKLHESPEIPNYKRPGRSPRIMPGMVFAIEPMVNIGTSDVIVMKDGWTVVTADKSCSAHFEHSVLVTDDEPEILSKDILKSSF